MHALLVNLQKANDMKMTPHSNKCNFVLLIVKGPGNLREHGREKIDQTELFAEETGTIRAENKGY